MFKKFTLVCLCMLLTQLAWAQHRGSSIRGQVLQGNGQPLAAASIVVENTPFGTVTDENGFFKILHIDRKSVV